MLKYVGKRWFVRKSYRVSTKVPLQIALHYARNIKYISICNCSADRADTIHLQNFGPTSGRSESTAILV